MLLAMICTLLISVGTTPAAYAAGKQQNVIVNKADFHFIVDGKVYHAPKETQGFLYNNRVYVPIRFASYLLEKWVDWNNSTATVSIKMPSATQLKQLQGYKAQYLKSNADTSKAASAWKKETIYASVDVASYNFFGKKLAIPNDVTTFIHKGTLYVPLRYFAESIEHDITYNSATKSVIMKSRSNSEQSNPDGTSTGNDGNDGNTGSNGEVTPPTRAEIVAATEAELKQLETRLSTKAFALATKIADASSDDERAQYIAQGWQAVADADAEVAAIIEQMNDELAKYDYEIGNDGQKFLELYEAKKDAMYQRFLS